MNTVLKSLAIAGLAGGLALPVAAATDEMDAASMTCEDFMAMEAEDQHMAIDSMKTAMMEAEGAETSEEDQMAEMSDEDKMAMQEEELASMSATCAEDPSMMATDAMPTES